MADKAKANGGSEEKRSHIRKAAFRTFRDKGYHQATVDDICRLANISKGSFYWYFSSKQEVFLEILDKWTIEVTEELESQFQNAILAEDNLPAIALALQREARRGRSIVPLWLEFAVYSREDPDLKDALSQFFGRIRNTISKMLRPAVGERVDESELKALSAIIFGAYSGLLIQEICDPFGVDSAKLVGRFLTVLQESLQAETPTQHEFNQGANLASAEVPTASAAPQQPAVLAGDGGKP